MNADRLMAYFERISDAPDAVDRLRKFVLDLAVRGKLVDQDPGEVGNNGPKSHPTVPFAIPGSWSWTPLRRIGKLSGGMTPSMSRDEFWGGEIAWLSPKDIKADEVSTSELRLTQKAIDETSLQLYPPGSLFIVARSGILKRTLPVALNRVAAAANQDMKVLVPFDPSSSRFLQLMLRGMTPFLLRHLVKTGTTVQSLKYSEFEEQDFPLPPLAEQHRIVAKVDELMKLCDRLEASQAERESRRDRLFVASLNTLSQPTDPDEFKKDAGFTLSHLNRLSTKPEHIKELRKTILNLAVRGKLVPLEATLAELEGRSYQSASQLVERLSGHPNRRKAAKQQSDARDCSSLPDLPNGWTWTTMPKIGELNRGRSRHRPRNEKRLYGGQYPFIQTGDVRRSLGTIQNYEQTYSEMGLSQSRMWPKNTLCITIAANIADTGILTFDACFPDSVVGFRYDDAAMPVRYIEYFLRTAKDRLSDFAPATAQKNINLDVLANVNVPLPPLAEQKRIVAKVDELMGICDQLEHQLESQQKGRRQLLEALLHEALEGVG